MIEARGRLDRVEPSIVAALALTYFLLYSVLSVLRHLTYHSFGSDLGLFDQVFWNTTQGRFFESTMSLAQPQPHSYIGDHFSPIYLLLLPVYALIPGPQPLVGMAFGAYLLLGKRDLKLGLGVLAGSLAAFLALIRVIIPALGGGSYAYFASRLAFRYAELGSIPQDIMATAVRHPGRIAHLLFQAQKLKFLAGIFGPVLGLSLISGFAVVLVIPTLALLLLSDYDPPSAFTNQDSAPLIPLVIWTSILGFARLRPSIQRPVAGAVLLSSLAFAYLFGDLPFSRPFQAANFLS